MAANFAQYGTPLDEQDEDQSSLDFSSAATALDFAEAGTALDDGAAETPPDAGTQLDAFDALDVPGRRLEAPPPSEQPNRIKTAGSQFVRGVGQVASGLPKSAALLTAPDADVFLNLDRIERGEAPRQTRPMYDPGGLPLDDPYARFYEDYVTASPQQRQTIRSELNQKVDEVIKSDMYQAGTKLDEYIANNFPINEEYQEEFWSSKVPQALGSGIGFLTAAAVTRGVAGTGPMATFGAPALLGSSLNRSGNFEQALNEGADIGTALKASEIGAVIGYSEAIPIGNLLNRLDKVSGGQIKKLMARMVQQGTEEAVQESMAGILNVAFAERLYNPEAGIWTMERAEEGAVGFTTGALLEALVTLAMPGRRKGAGAASVPTGGAVTNAEFAEEVDGRIAELNTKADQAELTAQERSELDYLRENRGNLKDVAVAYGRRVEPTFEERVDEELANLTEDDRASPIPDELIAEGRAVTSEAQEQAPEEPAQDKVITNQMRDDLGWLGYSAADINAMNPASAREILDTQRKKPGTAPLETQDVRETQDEAGQDTAAAQTEETTAQADEAGRPDEPAEDVADSFEKYRSQAREDFAEHGVSDRDRVVKVGALRQNVGDEAANAYDSAYQELVDQAVADRMAKQEEGQPPPITPPGGQQKTDEQQFEAYKSWIEQVSPETLKESGGMFDSISFDERLTEDQTRELIQMFNEKADGQYAERVPDAAEDIEADAETAPEPTAAELDAREEGATEYEVVGPGQSGKFAVFEDGAPVESFDTREEAEAAMARMQGAEAPAEAAIDKWGEQKGPTGDKLRAFNDKAKVIADRVNQDNVVPVAEAKVGDTIDLDDADGYGSGLHAGLSKTDPMARFGVVLDEYNGAKLYVGLQYRGPSVDPARGNKPVTGSTGLFFGTVGAKGRFYTHHDSDFGENFEKEAIAKFRRLEDEEVALDAEANLENLREQIVVIASGMSRTKDLEAGTHAWGGLTSRGIGVDVGELSGPGIEQMAKAVVDKGAQVFIDSGAFTLFRRNMKRGESKALDFDAIFAKYDKVIEAISEANAVEDDIKPPLLVMPDVIGDQAASLALVSKYRQNIATEATFNLARPIVPLQKGDITLKDAYDLIVQRLGTDNFIVGIPANKEAVSPEEFAEFVKAAKPKQIHFLGAASDKTLGPYLQVLADANIELNHLSADANILRSTLYGKQDPDKTRREAIVDTLVDRAGPEFEAAVYGPAPLRIEEFSEKSIIVRGLTKENKERIKVAVPGLRAIWNKNGKGWLFPKAREAEVREGLVDLLEEGEFQLADKQDFGDIKITFEVEVEESGEWVSVTDSAQKLFDQESKRLKNLSTLLDCVNG